MSYDISFMWTLKGWYDEPTPLAFSSQQVGREALTSPGFLILFTRSLPALPTPQAAMTEKTNIRGTWVNKPVDPSPAFSKQGQPGHFLCKHAYLVTW